jgi:outer membrane immunogenic protein
MGKAPDMPVKAPLRFTNWNGFYGGVNVGYGVGRDPTSYAVASPGFSQFETFYVDPSGIVGGAQIGYNWQFGNIVAGIESDIQGSAMQDSACVFGCITNATFNLVANVEQKLPWFGTTRGRFGYVVDSGSLFYLTGGLAYGEVKTSVNHIQGVFTASAASNDVKSGWVVGGGVEVPLDRHWKAKMEYLYFDLGSQSIAFTGPLISVAETSSFRQNIFRLGLNYDFN